ncbi:MAG: GntR family transcriptional regulator [Clostridiales bacterium]|nr:GntR family transcriptional regulator [Clostridiales bacterium]
MRVLPRKARENNRDYALRTLRENIIHLDLPPGSRISENELAAQLGLSRTPIREALMELARVRLVEVYPQRGSAIALIDDELVEEARFLRSVMECAVVELACRMATEDNLLLLMENVARQEYYLAQGQADQLWRLDGSFHSLLFAIARKEQTHALMSNLTLHFDRVRNMTLNTVENSAIVSDHRAIAQAVAARDEEAAKRLMSVHLSRYQVDKTHLLERYPAEYFKESC